MSLRPGPQAEPYRQRPGSVSTSSPSTGWATPARRTAGQAAEDTALGSQAPAAQGQGTGSPHTGLQTDCVSGKSQEVTAAQTGL